MGLLEGKTGLVTGASSGLGRATAELAAREGSFVTVADIDQAGGEQTVARIQEAGGEALFVETDVADSAAVAEMVKRTVDARGGLDWASNNAVGGAGGFGALHETDDATWERTLDVCLRGVFHGLRHEIPAMLASGGGSIINITTASVFKGEAMVGAYTAAKGGVESLTRTAAAEYSARGLRINTVAPGGMATPAILRYFEQFPEYREKTVGSHAIRRLAEPEEVAEAVIWLASDRASFVTGTCLECDGGVTVNSHML